MVRVPATLKLNEAMDLCKRTHQHMMMVVSAADAAKGKSKGAGGAEGGRPPILGLITMEDLIEELIQVPPTHSLIAY